MLDEDAYEGYRRGQSTATADANSAQDRAWTLRRPNDEHAVARHYSGVTDRWDPTTAAFQEHLKELKECEIRR